MQSCKGKDPKNQLIKIQYIKNYKNQCIIKSKYDLNGLLGVLPELQKKI